MRQCGYVFRENDYVVFPVDEGWGYAQAYLNLICEYGVGAVGMAYKASVVSKFCCVMIETNTATFVGCLEDRWLSTGSN
jgi:hypothetical protein